MGSLGSAQGLQTAGEPQVGSSANPKCLSAAREPNGVVRSFLRRLCIPVCSVLDRVVDVDCLHCKGETILALALLALCLGETS